MDSTHGLHPFAVRRIAARWQWFWRNPVGHWSALFVVLSITVGMHDNNANPYSRYALLSAISEDTSLVIDNYRRDTCDWSRPPSGHYYSNKAPGAALLALPLFLPVDALVVAQVEERPARDRRRLEARNDVLDYLSVTMQALPFALLVMVAASMLAARGASRAAIELTALAMLFGNTSSLLMNMFYGHGLAAVLTLAMVFVLHQRRYALAGLLLGLNVLTDYGSALFLPIVLASVLWPAGTDGSTRASRIARLGAGGLAPFLIFAGYHTLCFGGPLTLANKYMNPVFVENGKRALWGVIDFFPSLGALHGLLFDGKRSLLVTQPWVLILLLILPPYLQQKRQVSAPLRPLARTWLPAAWVGLLLLFLMNASFGGWHGGVCPGPRYLSAAFPLLGVALGLVYDSVPRLVRRALWCAVLPSVVLFVIVRAGDPAIWPYHAIWRRCLDVLFNLGPVKNQLRFAWIVLAFALTASISVFRAQRARTYPAAPPASRLK